MSEAPPKPVCGVIMPISLIDGCTESHWGDVLEILTESIESAGFDANLVSNADDVGIIHKRIIHNLYDNPVVVCDVSGKNPNVMFELGLRLAFDKPTVIVKDEKTSYSFDTGAIEHLEYPRDLRFSRIVEFKQKLADKIAATHKKATSDPGYTTFLKHFGEFKVAKLDKKEVPGQEFILEELKGLRLAMRRLELGGTPRELDSIRPRGGFKKPDINACLAGWPASAIKELHAKAKAHPAIRDVRIVEGRMDHSHLFIFAQPGADVSELERLFAGRSKVEHDAVALLEDL